MCNDHKKGNSEDLYQEVAVTSGGEKVGEGGYFQEYNFKTSNGTVWGL